MGEIPEWIKTPAYDRQAYIEVRDVLRTKHLHTVCVEANCPNRYECFSHRTATFMILGDVCTRNCAYCNVQKGTPKAVDRDECKRIADAVGEFGLSYVVITCVTRDDLADGGASVFVQCVEEIRKVHPESKIELLISDLNGNWDALRRIVDADVNVLNHNIEVVQRLFGALRPGASYRRSLELLRKAKELKQELSTKSGLMLGLGESWDEIIETLTDLRGVGCNYLSIGQYLCPSKEHTPVQRFYKPEEFEELKKRALNMGFQHVESGPLVRSSYHAHLYGGESE